MGAKFKRLFVTIVGIFALAFTYNFISASEQPEGISPSASEVIKTGWFPVEPQVRNKKGGADCYTGIFDCWEHGLLVSGDIFNPGCAGSFEVTAAIFLNNQKIDEKTQVIQLNGDGSQHVSFRFNNLSICPMQETYQYSLTATRLR